MRILVLDTALNACSAALVEDKVVLAVLSEAMERGHAEALMPMVARLLDEAGGAPPDRVAATIGPGSFTGLRVAVSAARGLALAWGVPAVGVTTLQALAQMRARQSGRAALAVIDARRDEAYWQAFDGTGLPLGRPALSTYAEIVAMVAGRRFVAFGSGARTLVARAGTDVEAGQVSAPDPVDIARLGMEADPASAPASPLYIRAPDAKAQDASRRLRMRVP